MYEMSLDGRRDATGRCGSRSSSRLRLLVPGPASVGIAGGCRG